MYNSQVTLRRAFLFLPGSQAKFIAKSRQLAVDGLIIDLEDALAPAEKAAARQQVAAELVAGGFGNKEVLVRINALGSNAESELGYADLQTLVPLKQHFSGLVLPKVNTVAEVAAVRKIITDLDQAVKDPSLKLWIMLETARGILDARELVKSDPELAGVIVGTSDLAKDLHLAADKQRLGLQTALSMAVLAARSQGLDILDGVFLDIADEEGLEGECQQGKALGFTGKTLIHPRQIPIVKKVFSPTVPEVEEAKQVIAAFSAAKNQGRGVTLLKGKLLEELHLQAALYLLAQFELLQERDQE